MKRSIYCLLLVPVFGLAQNTFPSTGNVGIGTSSPAGLLHLYSTTNPILKIESSGNTYLQLTDGSSHGYLIKNGSSSTGNNANPGSLYTYTTTGFDFQHIEGGTPRFTIKSGGYVGIGITSPTLPLHVVSNESNNWTAGFFNANGAKAYLAYGGNAAAYFDCGPNSSSSGYAFYLNKVGTPYLFVRGDGLTGIGTSTPTHRFDVLCTDADNWTSEIKNTSNGARMLIGNGGGYGALLDAGSNASAATYALTVVKESTPLFYVQGDGKVGVGTNAPVAKLDVIANSNARFLLSSTATDHPALTFGDVNGNPQYGTIQAYELTINNGTVDFLKIIASGNVGIGISPSTTDKLSVNGTVRAKKIMVTQSGWTDYVFNDNYQLRDLSSLESFIKTNKHLPEIPSAKEVEENGISVGDNQALLLKKIEELTLYIIAQQKEIDLLKKHSKGR